MNLGGNELQFFVTFLVVLGCAFIALLVDYMKGSHEQLRERHVDLLVRQEKFAGRASEDATHLANTISAVLSEQTAVLQEIAERPRREAEAIKRDGLLEPQKPVTHLKDIPVWSIPEPKRAAPAAAVNDGDKVKISLVPEPVPAPTTLPESAPAAELEPVAETLTEPLVAASAPPDNVVPIREAEALAEKPESSEPAPAHDFDRFLDDLVNEFEANPARYPQPDFLEPAPATETAAELSPVRAEAEALAETPEAPSPLAAAEPVVPALPPDEAAAPQGIPAGVFPADELDALLLRGERVSGLVISIGINDYEQLKNHTPKGATETLSASVERLIESFVRSKTFASMRGEDEFVLVDPDLSGPLAQRRLNEISERLWDFQLRNLGHFSVVFAWGAQEAHGETLVEALEAARERMLETRANRRNSSFEKSLRRLATA